MSMNFLTVKWTRCDENIEVLRTSQQVALSRLIKLVAGENFYTIPCTMRRTYTVDAAFSPCVENYGLGDTENLTDAADDEQSEEN